MSQTSKLQTMPVQTVKKITIDNDNGQYKAPDAAETVSAGNSSNLMNVFDALRAHEAQMAEQQRRADQTALQARQRFD